MADSSHDSFIDQHFIILLDMKAEKYSIGRNNNS